MSTTTSGTLIEPATIEDAAHALRGVANRTPLLRADWLTEAIGAETRLKCENLLPAITPRPWPSRHGPSACRPSS